MVSVVKPAHLDCNVLKLYSLFQAALGIMASTIGKSDQVFLTTIFVGISEVINMRFMDHPICQLNNSILIGNSYA